MKKRLIWLLLAAVFAVFCCACNKTPVENPAAQQGQGEDSAPPAVFPNGTTICGVDVSGMQAEEAAADILQKAESYTLTLNLGSETMQYTAEDFLLRAGEADFAAILDACLSGNGAVITVDNVLAYDLSPVEEALAEIAANTEPPTNAYLQYNEETARFEIVPEGAGTEVDVDYVMTALEEAILALQPELTLAEEDCFHPAEITADSDVAQDALTRANAMLQTNLVYTYAPSGWQMGRETVDSALILPWLVIQEDGLTVEVDPGPLNDYVTAMYEEYSLSNNTSTFRTSRGREIEIRVPSPGETVDTDALYNDLLTAITSGASGERTAPYIAEDEEFTADFGGNYVEIDLGSQHLWVYNNGELVVETDIVTGCVNTGHATPGGVYTIKDKETERYLVGPDYKSWVNYWMPFNGGIGLHDADGWRWAYGGSIYLYNGSHGCINMPYSAAAKTYENVSIGTYVVLYGGTYSVPPLTQSIKGTSSYTVSVDDADFKLDAKPTYDEVEMVYASSNPGVVTVSETGVVSIVGPGKATIMVTAVPETGYTEATFAVTVTVNSRCSLGDHTWDAGTVTTEPSCNVEGVRTYTCSACEQTKTEAIAKVGHVSDQGVVTKAATCGADGTKTFCCTVCGEALRTETIAATGSHTEDSGKVTTSPTCTAEGVKSFNCGVCGKVLRTESIPATGVHTEDGGTVTKQPTCTEAGEKVYKCTGCGTVTRTESLNPSGHTPDAGTEKQAATCTADGLKSHICTSCGAALPDSTIPAKGHTYVNGSCTGCQASDPSVPQNGDS